MQFYTCSKLTGSYNDLSHKDADYSDCIKIIELAKSGVIR
jgi:hypothetical protein